MTAAIDLRPDHREIVERILREHLPRGVRVWVFGSRAEWTTKDSSDLDLALDGDEPLDSRIVMGLELAFEESLLPFSVDVVDIHRVDESFREIVCRTRVVLPCFSDRATTYSDRCPMRFGDAFIVNPSVKLLRDVEYPFVAMSDLSPGSREAVSSARRRFRGSGSRFRAGDTLMARITPCLENGKIARFFASGEGEDVGHGSTEFIVIRGRPEETDSEFGHYVALWDVVRKYAIAQMSGTSGRQRVPTEALKSLTIPIPGIHEQRAIARVLGTLDDRIELNRRMNETLEAMARALYKSWFVDFDPVRAKIEGCDESLPPEIADLFPDRLVESELGEVPEGWEIAPLDTIAVFRNGLALQRFRPENDDEWLPVLKIAHLRKGSTDGVERARASIEPEFVVDDGDIVFSWSGSLELRIWTGGRAALNQHLFKVSPDSHPKWFVFRCIESHLEAFRAIAAGKATTMGHIKREHLREALCVIPHRDLLEAVSPVFERLEEITIRRRVASRELHALRDALLPKLVSGGIRLPAALVDRYGGAETPVPA